MYQKEKKQKDSGDPKISLMIVNDEKKNDEK